MRIITTCMLLAIGLAACSQEAPTPPSENPAKAEVPETTDVPVAAPTTAARESTGDSIFSVSPGSFSACDATDGAVVGIAKWDVSAQGVSEVALYVESPGNARKLWLNGGATGEEKTGNWVFDQTKFTLKDRLSDKEIAQLTVVAIPCQ